MKSCANANTTDAKRNKDPVIVYLLVPFFFLLHPPGGLPLHILGVHPSCNSVSTSAVYLVALFVAAFHQQRCLSVRAWLSVAEGHECLNLCNQKVLCGWGCLG